MSLVNRSFVTYLFENMRIVKKFGIRVSVAFLTKKCFYEKHSFNIQIRECHIMNCYSK